MSKHKNNSDKKQYDYDAIVIGSGPGGEGASMKLAKGGLRVAVVEKYKEIGGGCTHWGTIPSKALRHSVSQLIEINNNAFFSRHYPQTKPFTFADALTHSEQVISKQVMMRRGFYQRNNCELHFGEASFVDKHTLIIKSEDGSSEQISAKDIIIATGSRPYHPDDIDFTARHIYDSDTILSLNDHPQHIAIYGAGVIGSEYASIFRGLGVKTDLINTQDRLLSFLDTEMSDAISYHFRNSGIILRHDEAYEKIEATEQGVVLHFKSGKKMQADCLLFANGRTGNTDTLNLSHVGLTPDQRGQLTINQHYQTEVNNIYAVGDVIGYPSLASAAYDQGRIAAHVILTREGQKKLIKDIPTGIYTIPEMSSVGKTEQMLTQQKIPYEVGRAQFKDLARSQILGCEVGSLKILFHRESKEILGIHCFGERAAEIIHIGQAIMEQEGKANNIEYFVNTTFNYPTMAEAYRVAALNGLNRLF
ncbi:Si-specific NAD(P)(+) transhydrogenase [Psychromonas antarctica]|jgi:NAD(P) transhydrogenase|uniref:Si-specific NAD(P)(+) transhydrogenase n=1 Tax=Psychromonas antarctica TaxID=67573 RepID=UPI001EE8EC2E|nr:Si-specific NAD(P)(+) transhydrogenase [Psychromonas antarctica]MCG6200077.1 Si-specific NAD(P)(+) transhydrogenase [Psychromonas antarctica]